MVILWRHILRTHSGPFVFSVFLLMGIFLLQFLMKYLDQLAGKGLSALTILELIVLNLAWMVVLAVPMAVLIATLMAFGKLSSTNEVTAFRASGISLYRMLLPVFLASIGICYIMIVFNNDILPDANHRTKILTTQISRKKPTLTIVPGMFIPLVEGHTLLVKKTYEYSNDLEGILIFDTSKPNHTAIVTAHHGTISFSADYRKLVLDLRSGEIHQQYLKGKEEYRIIKYKKHRITLNAEAFNLQSLGEGMVSRGDRELDVQTMQQRVDSLRVLQRQAEERIQLTRATIASITKTDSLSQQHSSQLPILRATLQNDQFIAHLYDLEARKYLVEIHKKYAIPFACIVFVFIGGPLGIMARRGTFGISASLSLGFFTLYWACLRGGEVLADRGLIDPWLSMWFANIILGILGLYLTYRVAHENVLIDWTFLTKYIPKSWRTEQSPESHEAH
ncbi:MAG: LptF/LptG family permease [Bacteroidetes bacterium]|nr:LptF/LptG family permease [Bacteroidota bacterium]